MVIELCGLPGCGKTTLVEHCMINPQIVSNRKQLFKNVRFRKQVFKFIPDVFLKSNEYGDIRSFIMDYPNSNKEFRKKLYSLNYAINHMPNKLIFLEEGPIQYITSIAFDEEIKKNDNLKSAINVLCKNEKLVFFCKCPVETSVQRLWTRKQGGYTNNGRYDCSDIDYLKKLLEIKNRNLISVVDNFEGRVIELSMEDTIEKNVRIVKDNIESIVKRNDLWL